MLDESIPEQLRDPDDRWFGLAVRARTIVYNPDLLDEADVPTTYEELAEPEWEGRICMRNANNDYQQSLVASMIAADGEEAVRRDRSGDGRTTPTSTPTTSSCSTPWRPAAARSASSTTTTSLGCSRRTRTSPVGLVWAEQDDRGVHVNISGGGITRYADDVDLGQQFLEWLATDGQEHARRPTTTSTPPTPPCTPSR